MSECQCSQLIYKDRKHAEDCPEFVREKLRSKRRTQTEAFLEFARNSVGMRFAVERMDGSGPEWVGADEVAVVVEAWAKQGS